MITNKDRLAITAAKLYYQSDYSQTDIAKELNLSRPSVSRLLHYAKSHGFVRIDIYDPIEDRSELSQKIVTKFNLKHVCIANSPIDDEEEIKKYIGKEAAEYL